MIWADIHVVLATRKVLFEGWLEIYRSSTEYPRVFRRWAGEWEGRNYRTKLLVGLCAGSEKKCVSKRGRVSANQLHTNSTFYSPPYTSSSSHSTLHYRNNPAQPIALSHNSPTRLDWSLSCGVCTRLSRRKSFLGRIWNCFRHRSGVNRFSRDRNSGHLCIVLDSWLARESLTCWQGR